MPIQKVLDGARVPVKIWTKDAEPEAEKQLLNTASLPFVFKHVAAMPDVHAGKGATIGSVIATKGAISPAAVGVDLGCGMAAVKLAINPQKILDKVKEIRLSIERSIPLGMNRNQHASTEILDMPLFQENVPTMDMDLRQSATKQLGSLGSGNHFCEVCLDTNGDPWVMLHSGSRGVGNKLAMRFIDKAKHLMDTYFIKLLDPDLAYLSEGTQEFDDYMKVVTWTQEFALQNRIEMMKRVLKDISHVANDDQPIEKLISIDCHHNYVAREHHFDQNVWVTRKGAVRARVGDMGIIPGSMGTGSSRSPERPFRKYSSTARCWRTANPIR